MRGGLDDDSGVQYVRGRGGDPWGRGRPDDADENPWGSYPEGDPGLDEPRGIPMRPPRPQSEPPEEEPPEESPAEAGPAGGTERDEAAPADADRAEEPMDDDDQELTESVIAMPAPAARPAADDEADARLAEAEREAQRLAEADVHETDSADELAGLVRRAATGEAEPEAEMARQPEWPAADLDRSPAASGTEEAADETAPMTPTADVTQAPAARTPQPDPATPAQGASSPTASTGPGPASPWPSVQPPRRGPLPPIEPPAGAGRGGGRRGGPPTERSSAGGPPPEPPPPPPPGLREQFGNTKNAASGLVRAHIDLAKAEFSEILDEVKRVAIVAGIVLGLLVLVAMLVPIGTTLWLGEWLFGSMGWGVFHGTELMIALVVAIVLRYLGLSGRAILGSLLVAAVIGVLFGIVFGLNLSNELWRRIGDAAFPGLAPETRPLVIGAATMAALVGILAFALGLRSGIGSAIGGLIAGAILGALIGAFSAITFGPQVGAALGVAFALLLWPILMGLLMARRGVDGEELKSRFYPDVTIETTKETIEWVRERTQRGPKS